MFIEVPFKNQDYGLFPRMVGPYPLCNDLLQCNIITLHRKFNPDGRNLFRRLGIALFTELLCPRLAPPQDVILITGENRDMGGELFDEGFSLIGGDEGDDAVSGDHVTHSNPPG